MRNFDNKSILLGIGMGVIIISILSIIYSAGMKQTMTKQEIVSKAKEYGMTENEEFVKTDKTKVVQKKQIETPKPVVVSPTSTDIIKQTPVPEIQEMNVSINSGDSSEIVAQKLLDSRLIDNKEIFLNEIKNLGLAASIEVGDFKIKKGTGILEIIKTVTKK